MRARLSLPKNCGTNPVWDDWSWSTETTDPGLLSAYFLMGPDLFPFGLHYLLLAVTNMYGAQRGVSSFKYRNIDGKTPSFASINMDLGWIWDNL